MHMKVILFMFGEKLNFLSKGFRSVGCAIKFFFYGSCPTHIETVSETVNFCDKVGKESLHDNISPHISVQFMAFIKILIQKTQT